MSVFGVILVRIFSDSVRMRENTDQNNEVSIRIQSECWKIRIRITPNTDTFRAVYIIIVIDWLEFDETSEHS